MKWQIFYLSLYSRESNPSAKNRNAGHDISMYRAKYFTQRFKNLHLKKIKRGSPPHIKNLKSTTMSNLNSYKPNYVYINIK